MNPDDVIQHPITIPKSFVKLSEEPLRFAIRHVGYMGHGGSGESYSSEVRQERWQHVREWLKQASRTPDLEHLLVLGRHRGYRVDYVVDIRERVIDVG